MERDEALRILRRHMEELQEYHVKSLAVFGSVARGEAGAASDVDILVEFERPVDLFVFLRLQRRLSEILGCRVDLATPNALHSAMRDQILAEAVYS